MSSSDCAYAEELYDLAPLQVLQWFQIISSIASIALVFYTAFNYLHRTIFENDTKELIIALYVFIVINSICVFLAQSSQLAYRYSAHEKCDAQVPKTWCIIRYTITVIVFSFVIVHIGITAKHLLSSLRVEHRTQTIVARVSIIIAILYPIIFGLMAYSRDSLDGRTAYCSGFTANSTQVLMFNLHLILVLDILNVLVSLLLWKYNVHKLQFEQSYDLSLSFHRRQNLYAMRQFLPVATLHAAVYAIFFLTVYFNQMLQSSMSPGWHLFTSAVANVIPHYCYLCPLIFLILIRRGHFERSSHVQSMLRREDNSNEIYFTGLRNQWK